ncbi:hypothetical protein KP509_04G075800 [Ceratopteris richardii]|uniref:Uncharacterized protein n=1 Tax=Ceratopteris richardii TaxID=49495 RepID=A0A8T2V0P6_CERRI|nr:hypothetical protein KP509_04G075800 [Ceratopteris richardii]
MSKMQNTSTPSKHLRVSKWSMFASPHSSPDDHDACGLYIWQSEAYAHDDDEEDGRFRGLPQQIQKCVGGYPLLNLLIARQLPHQRLAPFCIIPCLRPPNGSNAATTGPPVPSPPLIG